MWTLNEALQECSRNTFNSKSMVRTNTGYAGKGLEYATRFLSGINYALGMIAREKFGPTYSESITLDEYAQYSLDSLSKPFLRLRATMDGSTSLSYSVDNLNTLTVDGYPNTTITATYEYMPSSLTMLDLDVALPLDDRYVDPRVVCQYADYQFLSENATAYDSANAQTWLGLFNDSFSKLQTPSTRPRRVRYTG